MGIASFDLGHSRSHGCPRKEFQLLIEAFDETPQVVMFLMNRTEQYFIHVNYTVSCDI